MDSPDKNSPKSPCIRNCKYNDDNICVACFRTKKEIFYWGDYTDDEKREILKQTGLRRKKLQTDKT